MAVRERSFCLSDLTVRRLGRSLIDRMEIIKHLEAIGVDLHRN
jgi:hypothetical protein